MSAGLRLHLSVGLLSAAALAYQLLLLRLLAIVQWSMLAGTVVSLALLAHGASGTALALLRGRAAALAPPLYAAGAACFALTAPLCFALAQRLPFNALELAWDAAQWPRLAAVYGLLALPFFFAAACFGLAFIARDRDIARIYAADLAGAALGAAALTLLLWWVSPQAMLRLVALLAVLSAALRPLHRDAQRPTGRLQPYALALLAGAVLFVPESWIAPKPSPYKGEQQLLAVIGARRLEQRSSPYGTLSVVASPRVPLRHAPGLSLQASAEPPPQLALFTDGDAMTVITAPGDLRYLAQLTSALPYALRAAPRVLVLDSGGGEAVRQAFALGAAAVTAVEPNPQRLALVRDGYRDAGGAVYTDPRVRAVAADPRAFLRRDRARYALIQLPPAQSFAGSGAGALASAEAYLYTVEAVGDALDRLTDGGLLAYTQWERLPPRASVKLLATVIAALRERGVAAPGARLAMIRSWQTSTLIVKNGALDAREQSAIRAFCARLGFDLAYLPRMEAAEANRFHRTARPYLYEAAQALLSPQAERYIGDYKFDVAPARDDRPFFFQFFRWRTLPELLGLRAQGGVALLDVGYLLVVATALQALLYSLLLIGLPLLWLRGAPGDPRWRLGLYFAALGLAFLFIEIVWLHRLVLLLGHPLLAASAGLSAFLLFAGAGSAAAERWQARLRRHAIAAAAGALIVWLLLLEALWPRLVAAAAVWPLPLRALAAVLALAPLAACMGLPFPLGLKRVSERAPQLLPWAWGINGCMSVCAAVLASLLAMHFGFQSVLLAAAALYALAAMLLR